MAANCIACLETLELEVLVPTTSTVDDWERSSEYLDPANYDGTTYYLEAVIGGVSGLVFTLRDVTNSADLTTITTNSTSIKRYRSASFTPSAGNNLIQLRTPSIASGACTVYRWRIIAVQANATKTRPCVPFLANWGAASASHTATLDTRKVYSYSQTTSGAYGIWTYTAANWATLSAATFECVLWASTAGHTVYAALCKTDGTVVAECSTSSGTPVYLTASAALEDGVSYEVRLRGDSTGVYYAYIAKANLYMTLTPLSKGEAYFLEGIARARTSDASAVSGLTKVETGSYSTPVVYADATGFLAATDAYAAGHVKLRDYGTNDTQTGGSGDIASSAWNMNTTTAKTYHRAGPVTVTADDRVGWTVDYNAQTVTVATFMCVVAFTGTAGTTYAVGGTFDAVSGFAGSATANRLASATAAAVSGFSAAATAKRVAAGVFNAVSGNSLAVIAKRVASGTAAAVSSASAAVTAKLSGAATAHAVSGAAASVTAKFSVGAVANAVSGFFTSPHGVRAIVKALEVTARVVGNGWHATVARQGWAASIVRSGWSAAVRRKP